MKKITFGIMIIVALIFAAVSFGGLGTVKPDSGAKKVSIRLKWLHRSQFAGFYVADKKGFYAKEGLEVTLNPGGTDFPSIQTVVNGSDQFGMAGSEEILMAREKGIPVVAVAMIYPENPIYLYSLKESGIDSMEKLAGKKVALWYGDSDMGVYRAMVKNAGIDPKNIEEVPAQFGGTAIPAKQVDVQLGMFYDTLVLEDKGFTFNIIRPGDYGVRSIGSALFTTEKTIEEQPELVRKVVRATVQGWYGAAEEPDKAAAYALEYNDKLKKDFERKVVDIMNKLVKPDASPIGYMDYGMWKAEQDLLLQNGDIKQPVDLDKAFTTEFLP